MDVILLYHEIIFMFLHFMQLLKQPTFPFSIVSMLLIHASRLPSMLLIHASRFPSMLLRMPASPPLPFNNALEDALPPAFNSLDAYYLPPPFHSDYETHLTSTCCKSHFLLIRFSRLPSTKNLKLI